MMLPTTGPTTSLMEDLQDLGLVETKNSEPSASKGAGQETRSPKDAAGPDDGSEGPYAEGNYMVNVGDKDAGSRKNVPVRSDGNVGPSGKGAMAEGDAADDGDDDRVVAEGNGKMVPSFLIPSETDVQEAEEQAAELAEEDRLNRAWEVINTYFTESEDGLNEEGLRGVINAMGFALNVAVEDIANLTVENERMTEAVNELTGLLYEAEVAEGYNGDMDYSKGDEDDKVDKDDDEDEDTSPR